MKNHVLFVALFAWALFYLSACTGLDIFDCEKASDETISQTYNMADFDQINLYIDADVYLIKGTEHSVRLEGPVNVVNGIDLGVQNRTWNIDFERNVRCLRNDNRLKIYITLPEIRSFNLAGSGRVEALETFEANQFNLNISGSGEMRFDVRTEHLFSVINGSGNIILEGEATRHDIHISGSGDVLAFALNTDSADVSIIASGNAHLFVNDLLDVGISGSGSVFYKGRPNLSVSVSGSGKVVDRN